MRNLPVLLGCLAVAPNLAEAKKAEAKAAPKQASSQTADAIAKLMGKFKWDMTTEEAMKIVSDEIAAKFDEQVQKETLPAKQDKILKEKAEALAKIKDSHVKFDGQKTGWDVSIADREFSHKNDESMFVIWEKDQRRFLFFWKDRLWKQFIAFNAENPVFRDKTFDDFADIIQKRFGPASITFRKQRASDDQTLDHLEWPPSGDFQLWAIDLTTFYGNFCLSLMKKSAMASIEKAREENNPKQKGGSGIVDHITKPDEHGGDANADIVDEITGRSSRRVDPSAGASSDKGKKAPAKKKPSNPNDPLGGTDL